LLTTSLWSLPEILAELGRYDSSRWMGDVTVPTAVVVTARDWAIPTVRQRALADKVPDALVWEAPGGHTSVVLGTRRWLPIFLDAVTAVTDPPSTGRAAV
ncbi:MAG: alpha/beta hydrolase, partial [Actinobacteria bacterium]|nr:alpha/beta hydrolase [Actinomycetota bacterium]